MHMWGKKIQVKPKAANNFDLNQFLIGCYQYKDGTY